MKKQKRPFIVRLVIITAITSLSWTGFEVYRILTVKPDPEVPPEILTPVDPTLDQDALTNLENTLYLSDDELGTTLILSTQEIIEVPQPSSTPTPEEAPLETPTPEPAATEEAELAQ